MTSTTASKLLIGANIVTKLLLSRRTLGHRFQPRSSSTQKRHYHPNPLLSAMTSLPRIAIVGGGPGGLSLGLLLHQRNIPFTIFELRDKPTKEELSTPSGMLDLHEESGLTVLKECGLYDAFLPLTGECSQDFFVSNRNGKFLYNPNNGGGGGEGSRPEISRNNLIKLFLSALPAETIKWNHKLLSATKPIQSTQSTLQFDSSSPTFDLVIGADGAWSKVRSHLLPGDTKPAYTGMQIITLTIKNITTKYPHLAKLVGSGTFSSLGNRHAVISQRGPIDSARIFLWITFPDEDIASGTSTLSASKTPSEVKGILLNDPSLFGTFGPLIKELISTAFDEELAEREKNLEIRPLCALPYGFSWEHTPGVTLVGDAAHLMLPNGEGVNSAMFDSLILARAIVKAWEATATNGDGGDRVEAFQTAFGPLLKESEKAMVERAVETGKETEVLIRMMFGDDDAAYGFVKFFEEIVAMGGEK